MADTNKKVSELETASQVNNTDLVMLSQGSSQSGFVSLKTTILAIAQKIVSGINFTSDLQTESKTITGAINEVASGGGGSSTFAGLSDVDIDDTTLANGQVPVWDDTEEKWKNGNGGGGTTVIANPTGTPTDELNSIQIGNDIYEIVGEGGGGIIADKDLLWEYSDSYDITLAHPFTDYDFLIFEGNNYTDSNHKGGAIVSSTELESIRGVSGKQYSFAGVTANGFANYLVSSTTSILYDAGDARVLRVWGIKFTSGGGSADWTDVTGTLIAGQTEITLYDSDITANSTFDTYTNKFGVNPTNMEFISDYRLTDFMDGKITVRENLNDSTDIKLFINGLTKDSSFLPITDTDLLDYLSDITSGYLKACSTYDTATSTTATGILAIGDWGSGMVIGTYIPGWSQYKAGTFYGVIDLNESPVPASGTPTYQVNEYENPYDMAGGVKLTFPVQSENLNVKVRVS